MGIIFNTHVAEESATMIKAMTPVVWVLFLIPVWQKRVLQ